MNKKSLMVLILLIGLNAGLNSSDSFDLQKKLDRIYLHRINSVIKCAYSAYRDDFINGLLVTADRSKDKAVLHEIAQESQRISALRRSRTGLVDRESVQQLFIKAMGMMYLKKYAKNLEVMALDARALTSNIERDLLAVNGDLKKLSMLNSILVCGNPEQSLKVENSEKKLSEKMSLFIEVIGMHFHDNKKKLDSFYVLNPANKKKFLNYYDLEQQMSLIISSYVPTSDRSIMNGCVLCYGALEEALKKDDYERANKIRLSLDKKMEQFFGASSSGAGADSTTSPASFGAGAGCGPIEL